MACECDIALVESVMFLIHANKFNNGNLIIIREEE